MAQGYGYGYAMVYGYCSDLLLWLRGYGLGVGAMALVYGCVLGATF